MPTAISLAPSLDQNSHRFLPRLSLAAVFIFASLLLMAIASAAPEEKSAEKTTEKSTEKTAEKKHDAKKEKAEHVGKILPKDVNKLIVEDTIVGNGKTASKNKTIKVQYTGWLYDPSQPMGRGKQFDTSVGKEPFSFQLGSGKVIKGWDDGFNDMKVGGKRKLIIPSEMGYGTRGAGGDIPPNSALMFEVELLDVD